VPDLARFPELITEFETGLIGVSAARLPAFGALAF
jgi:hypothetical protein